MLKVAILGCGKIADQHAEQIQRISGCEVVAVCDKEELMARQLQERFSIRQRFADIGNLLKTVRPDVVHITTPPQSHFKLGKICLEAGCHVYIEKPFTVNTTEAEELIGLANDKKLKLTAGHNVQFSHAARRMRKLIKEGFLGGAPLHIESYYCYDLADVSYARAVLSDRNHWVRRLPGGLLQNIISHGISKVAEFLESDSPTVVAHGFTSSLLKSIGETDIIDELRVIISDNQAVTAYFTFSSQMRPVLHQLRVYGPHNALIIDDDQQTVIKLKGSRYKSYLEQFIPPWAYTEQYLANFVHNVGKFLKADFHMDHGMRFLIDSFYRSISEDSPPPIPYREILLTSRIMDDIFCQLKSASEPAAVLSLA